MNQLKQEIVLYNGGLNSDDNEKFYPLGDGDRYNCIVSGDGENGIITNANGNELVTLPTIIAEYSAATTYAYGDMIYVETIPWHYAYKYINATPSSGNTPPTYGTDDTYWESVTFSTYNNTKKNKVIGSCRDDNSNSIFFFLYNYLDAHCLFRYNIPAATISKIIFQEPNLNFSIRTIRLTAKEFDGKIYWNDGYDYNDDGINEPRKINVELAYNHANYPLMYTGESVISGDKRRVKDTIYEATTSFGVASLLTGSKQDSGNWEYYGDAYESFSDMDINVIKQPPVNKLNFLYLIDTDVIGTSFRNVFCRFSYRYQYYDNEYSAVSPWTDYTVHSDDLLSADGTADSYSYNYIGLRFNSGNTYNIKRIQLLAEFSDQVGIWKIIKEIDVNNNVNQGVYSSTDIAVSTVKLVKETEYMIRFYNNTSYLFIDSGEAIKLFDNVPLYAGAYDLIGNRNIYGDVTTGYDQVDIDVDVVVGSTGTYINKTTNIGTDTINGTSTTLTIVFDLTTSSFNDDIKTAGVVQMNFSSSIAVYDTSSTQVWISGTAETATFVAERYDTDFDINLQIADQLDLFLDNNLDTSKATKLSLSVSDTQITLLLARVGTTVFTSSATATASSYISSYAYIVDTASAYETERFFGAVLKTGASHQFGLEYRDKFGRTNGTNTTQNIIAKIPYKYELAVIDIGAIELDGYKLPYVELTINHLPPTWAESCYLTYSGNTNYEFVLHFIVDDHEDIDLDGTGTADYFIMKLPASANYQYQKGDFIRNAGIYSGNAGYKTFDILRVANTAEIMAIKNAAVLADYTSDQYRVQGQGIEYTAMNEEFDTEVRYGEQAAFVNSDVLRDYARTIGRTLSPFNYKEIANLYIESQRQQNISDAQTDLLTKYANLQGAWLVFRSNTLKDSEVDANFSYEILRSVKSSKSGLFHEFIEIPIYESAGGVKYHGGDQTQSPTDPTGTPSIISFAKGDVWNKVQDYGAGKTTQFTTIPLERNVVTDFAPSSINNLGRRVVSIPDFQQIRTQDLLYSNQLIPNTFINGLSSFPFSNVSNLNQELGYVRDIKSQGDLIHILQQFRVSSGYFNQGEFVGELKEKVDKYGTEFKVLQTEKYIYGFDIHQGVFWRLAYNGIYPISGKVSSAEYQYDYKMFKYFKDKSATLLESGISNIDVTLGYDYRNQLIFVTFLDSIHSSNNETIAFSESNNRWISYFNFQQDSYEYKNNIFFSFKGGNFYVHSDSATKCNYNGVQYQMKVDITSNISPNIIKLFNAIHVHSNVGFDITDINIPSNINYGSMASKLDEEEFKTEEGIYKASYLRNMKTRTDTPTNFDLRNGERLRGYTVKNTIEYDTTRSATDIELFKVDVLSDVSKT